MELINIKKLINCYINVFFVTLYCFYSHFSDMPRMVCYEQFYRKFCFGSTVWRSSSSTSASTTKNLVFFHLASMFHLNLMQFLRTSRSTALQK